MNKHIVMLDAEQITQARIYAQTVTRRLPRKPNYTGFAAPDRYFVGRCGELALCQWAQEHGLEYIDTVNDRGAPDDQDVVFPRSGITVNVKNSHHPRARYLLQPEAQAVKRFRAPTDPHYLVGCTGIVTEEQGEMCLHGAIHRRDWMLQAERKKINDLTALRLPLAELPLSMDGFLTMLKQRH